ncbi:MAG: hypothetical protein NE330_16275 [Lentisphaeraceae bacterium]|nr:hypothetical protein [Lentisphaeraceae bacterium]
MNRLILSTLKVIALFSASTLLAYFVLRAQIKSVANSRIQKENSQSSKGHSSDLEDSGPVITTVASSKSETLDVSIEEKGLDLVLEGIPKDHPILKTVGGPGFSSSKSIPMGNINFSAPEEKPKYITLEKEEPDNFEVFFESSKAPLTTVVVENLGESEEKEKLQENADKNLSVVNPLPQSLKKELANIVFQKDDLDRQSIQSIIEENRRLHKLLKKKNHEIQSLKSELKK